MTLTEQNELDAIRARRAYGIHRNSDYNREYELTATAWTKLGEAGIIVAAFGFAGLKLWAIAQMIMGAL